MIIILLLVIGFLCLSPILGLLSQIQLKTISEIVADAGFSKSLFITIGSGIVASLVSLFLGLFFARQFARNDWNGKRMQRLLLLFPYLIPNFILAIAFVTAWNPTSGLLNNFFKFPGGLYGISGLIFLLAVAHMPVAFLLFEDKIKRIDSSLLEAAKLSGASDFYTFLKIILPLLRPTLISAFSICFALNISAFAIPAWIAAPEHIYPLTYKVYQAIQLGGVESLPEAAAISLVLFFLALIPIFIGARFQGHQKKYALLTGKSTRSSFDLKNKKTFAVFQIVFWACQFIFWIGPMASLFLTTVVKPGCLQNQGMSCFSEVSFSHYKYVIFDLVETKSAIRGSLLYGAISSFLVICLAGFTLLFLSNKKRGLKVAETIFMIPLSTPGAILALGLIVIYSGKFGINLYNTAWIAVMAYIIKHINLAFQPLKTGYLNISESLHEAARLSGASFGEVWRKVTLPLLKRDYLGGFFLVFIPILGELTMSVFLSSPKFKSIGTVLFDLQDYADQASASALAILLVVMILILNELSRLLSRGNLGY